MKIRSELDLNALSNAAKLLAVASAWTELGLWDALAERDGPTELSDLPADLRALTISSAVLAHAGLLDGGGSRWQMSTVARELHAAGAMPTERNLSWFGDLSRSSAVLAGGGPVIDADGNSKVTSGGVRPDDREHTRKFLDMLYRRSEHSANSCLDWVAPRLAAGAHVLDVGGGHGRYARGFVDRGFKATLFDMDMVVGLARERHDDKLDYRVGNFHDDAFGGPYAAALLSNIVHGESAEANTDMFTRLFAALEPGGWLILKDMFIDEQGRDPSDAVFFGMSMLFYTRAGKSYTLNDVATWCSAAGFESPEAISVDFYSLVFARKPA